MDTKYQIGDILCVKLNYDYEHYLIENIKIRNDKFNCRYLIRVLEDNTTGDIVVPFLDSARYVEKVA